MFPPLCASWISGFYFANFGNPLNLHVQIISKLIDAPVPSVFVFIALFHIWQMLVSKQDFGRWSQIAKLNGDQRFARLWVLLPTPREYNSFGRLDFSIGSGHAMDIAILVMHLHAIYSANC